MQQLVFVAKDTEPLLVSATEIMIHEPSMAIVTADMDKNVQLFQCVTPPPNDPPQWHRLALSPLVADACVAARARAIPQVRG